MNYRKIKLAKQPASSLSEARSAPVRAIRDSDLESLARQINLMAGANTRTYQRIENIPVAQVGTCYIEYSHGAAKLVQITTEAGDTKDVFGYCSKHQLFDKLAAYLSGMRDVARKWGILIERQP